MSLRTVPTSVDNMDSDIKSVTNGMGQVAVDDDTKRTDEFEASSPLSEPQTSTESPVSSNPGESPESQEETNNGSSTDDLGEGSLFLPEQATEGTTIAGLVYKDGVILGVVTQATEGGNTVADRNCPERHYIAPNILCYGPETPAFTKMITNMIASNISLSKLPIPQSTSGVLGNVKKLLEKYVHQYQENSSASSSNYKVHGRAALVLGRVDDSGPHLHVLDLEGNEVPKPYVAIGPGSLEALKIFRSSHHKQNMSKNEAMLLVRDAIAAGIIKDLDSGSVIDLFVIKTDNTLECRLPYRSVADGYRTVMKDLDDDIDKCFEELLKDTTFTTKEIDRGILSLSKNDGSEEENFATVYIVNPLNYAWELHKLYIESMPSKVTVLFVGMNPARSAPSGIPFDDGKELWEFLKINKSETHITIPKDICTSKKCRSAENFWRVITAKFEEEYREHCFVINFSPLLYVGSNGKDELKLPSRPSIPPRPPMPPRPPRVPYCLSLIQVFGNMNGYRKSKRCCLLNLVKQSTKRKHYKYIKQSRK